MKGLLRTMCLSFLFWVVLWITQLTRNYGQFYALLPQSTTNLITNPSFETGTTGWTAIAGSRTRVTTTGYQRRGAYGLQVTPTASSTDGVFYGNVTTTTGQDYTFSVDVYSDSALNLKIWWASTSGVLIGSETLFTTTAGQWTRQSVSWTETGGASRRLYVTKQSGSATTAFYIDGAQVENLAYDTSYCDGDQLGCRWTGTRHASTSQRSSVTRSGGKRVDLQTYNAYLVSQQGTGMPPVKNIATPYAITDGSYYQNTLALERPFTIAFSLSGDGVSDWHGRRADLIDLFRPNSTIVRMPMVLGYTDAGKEMEITAVYDGGLEMESGTQDIETIPVRCIAHDPYWYRLGERATALTVQQSVTNANYIIKRASDGTWSALSSGGTGGKVSAIAQGLDGKVYVGGAFTALSGVSNTAKIGYWDGSWHAMGTGASGGSVFALAVGADGIVYAGGSFTSMGGVANTSRIAKWDGSTWSALSTGTDSDVYALAFDGAGNLYVGGAFSLAGGVANTVRIARWELKSGGSWNALSTGMSGGSTNVTALATGLDGTTLYAGGGFTTAGGTTVNYIAKWNGTAWSAMAGGMNAAFVNALEVGPDGMLYAGGDFTTAGGTTVNRVARWNGTAWIGMGTGPNDSIYAWAFDDQGRLYGTGHFVTIGGITPPDAFAIWNGSAWVLVDANLPGTATINAVSVAGDGTVYFGYDQTGTAVTGAVTTATTTASADSYPVITVTGPTSTPSRIYSIGNTTTGEYIYLNTTINPSEIITIDLRPGRKSITSSFRGNIYGDILPGSMFSFFHLAPGSNSITFMTDDSSVTATMRWRERCYSLDSGAR